MAEVKVWQEEQMVEEVHRFVVVDHSNFRRQWQPTTPAPMHREPTFNGEEAPMATAGAHLATSRAIGGINPSPSLSSKTSSSNLKWAILVKVSSHNRVVSNRGIATVPR
jgi:hypothetical protein